MINSLTSLYVCHEADPHVWEDIRASGLALLKRHELDLSRDLIPDNEDLQDKWEAAMDDPGKYVTLLIGQNNDEEQQAESNKENYHNPFEGYQTNQNL